MKIMRKSATLHIDIDERDQQWFSREQLAHPDANSHTKPRRRGVFLATVRPQFFVGWHLSADLLGPLFFTFCWKINSESLV